MYECKEHWTGYQQWLLGTLKEHLINYLNDSSCLKSGGARL